MDQLKSDLAQVVRLALFQQTEDVRLFVARLVRKYRNTDPNLAEIMDTYLQSHLPKPRSVMRKALSFHAPENQLMPADDESRLSLLKVFEDSPDCVTPLLSQELQQALEQLIQERQRADLLLSRGLQPARSAIFVGPPGVGKTLTARWLAAQLKLPLYILDLTAVMSSLLGRSGSNLRTALDFAKTRPCVLLLDEIDSIAKRRSDNSDVGELKRLVTVILQEVDAWPASSLLLAATNYPELIDPALWRRFDLTIEFKIPTLDTVELAINQFLDQDIENFRPWLKILTYAFQGQSFSDIEKEIQRFRRTVALHAVNPIELVEDLVRARAGMLDHHERINFAVLLAQGTRFSQHTISEITGVSRDTIRKHKSKN
ncbi:MAG: ATP-binding protein [Puniceicoccales bacterium]|jgi:SpoVK/Ycf46/Vps4 family AAA+-type ATPase|nr:ATP-binding protein [Puniceicoccales bacterium]